MTRGVGRVCRPSGAFFHMLISPTPEGVRYGVPSHRDFFGNEREFFDINANRLGMLAKLIKRLRGLIPGTHSLGNWSRDDFFNPFISSRLS